MRRTVVSILFLAGLAACLHSANTKEFTHPDLLSFEEGNTLFTPLQGSTLDISDQHYRHGQQSLRWQWTADNASIHITRSIPWATDPKDAPDPSTYSFVFWAYSLTPQPGATLRFEFLKQGEVCSHFTYGLDFSGWRGAWVAFQRDMEGTPQPDMDELRIRVSGAPSGTLFFDGVILSSLQDLRQHTPDTQAPFINAGNTNHWLQSYNSTLIPFDIEIPTTVTDKDRSEMQVLEKRYIDFHIGGAKPKTLATLQTEFNDYQIITNPDGSLRGRPIYFVRYGETFFSMGHPRNSALFGETVKLLKDANTLLFNIGMTYRLSQNQGEREELLRMYLTLARYMLDQGFTHGSSLGTIHHLGYSMKDYYIAFLLMKDELYKAGIGADIQRAMEWFAITGVVKKRPTFPGLDIDTFNTNLMPNIASILMLPDSEEKLAYLYSFRRWLNNGFAVAPGLAATFKPDGTVFHHANHYPAYARDGMRGATEGVYILSGTIFAVSEQSHAQLKKALLTMRFHSHLTDFPVSMSGRHPKLGQRLITNHYALMALAGTPDGKSPIDKEMAAAYLRLEGNKKNPYYERMQALNINPEPTPNGTLQLPYGSTLLHRRGNWLAVARGHSRYFWAAETYESANLFGRYLTHGNLQLMSSKEPLGNLSSGYNDQGWDWNYWWGTTSIVLPISELRSTVLNVDTFSGNEEMLLSDEAFAGSVTLKGENGTYAMKLHEHDKYNGSHRARKSFFFFDNRVVCLGSDIENTVAEHPTVTTLFQEFIPAEGNAIRVNNQSVTGTDYQQQFTRNTSLADAQGNQYFVRNADVSVVRRTNHSLTQDKGTPVRNPFSIATIQHGNAPKGASYEYSILVQPSDSEINAWTKEVSKKDKLYSVLRQDRQAHIVRDRRSDITSYVLFEEGNTGLKQGILATTIPCMVMTQPNDKKGLSLSVADPDMRFYDGPSDEKFDAQGKRIERSVYSRTWINNPSQPSKVVITLSGKWELAQPSDKCRVMTHEGKNTLLEFTCVEGFSNEVELVKQK